MRRSAVEQRPLANVAKPGRGLGAVHCLLT